MHRLEQILLLYNKTVDLFLDTIRTSFFYDFNFQYGSYTYMYIINLFQI